MLVRPVGSFYMFILWSLNNEKCKFIKIHSWKRRGKLALYDQYKLPYDHN